MTNSERYKTSEARLDAFYRYCHNQACSDIDATCKHEKCVLEWLELEADADDPLPCPFCGSKTSVVEDPNSGACWVLCENRDCHYTSANMDSEMDAVDAHNRVCRAVAKYEKEEGK